MSDAKSLLTRDLLTPFTACAANYSLIKTAAKIRKKNDIARII
jgi:hypothetical protein